MTEQEAKAALGAEWAGRLARVLELAEEEDLYQRLAAIATGAADAERARCLACTRGPMPVRGYAAAGQIREAILAGGAMDAPPPKEPHP